MQHTRRRTLSALAGQVIGYRKDGRPIRLAAGGSGDADGDGAGSDGGDSAGGTDAGGDGQGGKGGQGDGTSSKDGPTIDGEFDAERARRAIAAAREAEKKAKGDAKAERERVAAILKAAGLTPDGQADPAEQLKAVAAERDAAAAQARDTAVELAVYKRAGKAGGDPDALLDSTRFRAAVKDLDPTAVDFDDKVTDAIKAAIKANPKLAAAVTGGQGPARQGTDHTGGNNGGRQRPAGLGAAIAARMAGQ
ncbi:hypothetical protein E1193_13430 [Micromonospora sp. KC606]|uniref:hypothetical protein n=1 Tax=Micromonospora sp. KC606 TaxID=2530379 RepID=UPI001048F50D|nr:hypothetical protein [Micromonospora sp. KC606]TDC81899.1 hypothetical protein E1193_13430 [Micromonospora sp. KC606]